MGGFGNVWDLCGWGFVLGRPNMWVRGGLEAPGSRVPNPMGFCLQTLWGYWVRQGSGRKEFGVVRLEEMNASQPCLAWVVGEIVVRFVGGWESDQVSCFRFSNPQILRD